MSSEKKQKRTPHFCDVLPKDPAVRRFGEWSFANQGFFAEFRRWLKASGYSDSALHIYSVAARQAIGFLDKPYWTIDPEGDIDQVSAHLHTRQLTEHTVSEYHKGLKKFREYLYLRLRKPAPPKQVNWKYFIGPLSKALQQDVRAFLQHCQRNWKPDVRFERTGDILSHLTGSLRWMTQHAGLKVFSDLTPQMWFRYLDHRMTSVIQPRTTNSELSALKALAYFLQEQEHPICERLLLVDYLPEGDQLPKDLPLNQLQRLQAAIQAEALSPHAGRSRTGRMDLAWFLLMLHSGLRSGEVRFLRLNELDCANRRLFIRQSKGLKDRIVYLSEATVSALQDYFEVRGPAEALPDNVFIYRHRPVSESYCGQRLRTYHRRCGVKAIPHQLRHSCATLLLNAGAPVLTVQALLGHKWVDTTLGYARLYDGTVAADYYQAMHLIERRLALPEDRVSNPISIGKLVALADSLKESTLSPAQAETVRQLRTGLRALQDSQNQTMEDVKVP